MTHAARILATLNEGAEDEDVDEETAARLRERAEEIRETLVTPVVEIRCHQCAGTSLITFEDPEGPDVEGRRWACPHCPLVDELDTSNVEEVALVSSHPEDVDTIDSLEDFERANGYGGTERWAVYREVVVKGRTGAAVARARGVTPGTVYSHVSRAKDAVVEATT